MTMQAGRAVFEYLSVQNDMPGPSSIVPPTISECGGAAGDLWDKRERRFGNCDASESCPKVQEPR